MPDFIYYNNDMISNCLIEAIKAKIKNPRIKIRMYPPFLNNGSCHFYWVDSDTVYHFVKNNNRTFILFSGYIKDCRKSVFYSFMGHRLYSASLSNKDLAIKLSKKYHLPFTEGDIEQIWFNEEND